MARSIDTFLAGELDRVQRDQAADEAHAERVHAKFLELKGTEAAEAEYTALLDSSAPNGDLDNLIDGLGCLSGRDLLSSDGERLRLVMAQLYAIVTVALERRVMALAEKRVAAEVNPLANLARAA